MRSEKFYNLLLIQAWMLCCALGILGLTKEQVCGQDFGENPSGLRPIPPSGVPSTATPTMVPINPYTQTSPYPSGGSTSSSFDPYSSNAYTQPTLPPVYPSSTLPPTNYQPSNFQSYPGTVYPSGTYPGATYPGSTYPGGTYPSGLQPSLPGTGLSGTVGTFPNTPANYNQPGIYPNSQPSALYPGQPYASQPYGSQPYPGYGGGTDWLTQAYQSIFGASPYSTPYAGTPPPTYPPAYPGAPVLPPGSGQVPYYNSWNPQGTIYSGGTPEFIRLFQGPRFRHSFLFGDEDDDSLMINDSDVAIAIALPRTCCSSQPVYFLPSFSLHQWAGPRGLSTADLPPLAYSAFLDVGWQSDPTRIFGAELGGRVGVFSDFETYTSDSLRLQGRAIGRMRITPRATLKGGVIYLDRNKLKLLPAGGILWQPNPDTRFDLFFPEPKLSHYLSTVGTTDTWWYVGGFYGGGSWTIQRESGSTDSIDINDIRLVLGFEWGRNDEIREGRRVGFFEAGFVFDRELLYRNSPMDNLDLQDTLMLRAGIGF